MDEKVHGFIHDSRKSAKRMARCLGCSRKRRKEMLEELLGFTKYFVRADNWNGNGFGDLILMILGLYLNAGFYLLDFYHLIKRKSNLETFFAMILPCVAAVFGGLFSVTFVHISYWVGVGFRLRLLSVRLRAAILLMIAVYFLLWLLAGRLGHGSWTKHEKSWVLSCIPDYVFCAVILAVTLSLFLDADLSMRMLWIYRYCIYFLFCKIVLLTVGILTLAYNSRITVFRWKEGKNPSAFLKRYFLLYQNAVFRNGLLYCVLFIVSLGSILAVSGEMDEAGAESMLILTACGALMLWLSSQSARKGIRKFGRWQADHEEPMKMFCREYFLEEPVYRDRRYTVTKHFLVDEQQAATVYYWPALRDSTGWILSGKGRTKTFFFGDGSVCVLTQEDEESAEKIIAFAKSHYPCPRNKR